jgi:rhomboid protease GluP
VKVGSDSSQVACEKVRRARWVTRAGIDVVTIMVGLNVLVFVYMASLSNDGLLSFIEWGAISVDGLKQGAWWQPFTHLFLHGGDLDPVMRVMHLGLNMLVIYQVGKELLIDVGTKHWLAVYFFSGLLGGFFQILVTKDSPLLGASGAAFGLITAFGSIHAHELLEAWVMGFFVKVNGWAFSLALMVSSALLGVISLASSVSIPMVSNMGHFAHLGGALGGVIYVRLFRLLPKPMTKASLLDERAANDARLEAQRTSHHS